MGEPYNDTFGEDNREQTVGFEEEEETNNDTVEETIERKQIELKKKKSKVIK